MYGIFRNFFPFYQQIAKKLSRNSGDLAAKIYPSRNRNQINTWNAYFAWITNKVLSIVLGLTHRVGIIADDELIAIHTMIPIGLLNKDNYVLYCSTNKSNRNNMKRKWDSFMGQAVRTDQFWERCGLYIYYFVICIHALFECIETGARGLIVYRCRCRII